MGLGNPPTPRTCGGKVCIVCKEWKPYTDFYVDHSMLDGRLPACKACHIARVDRNRKKRWAKQRREKREMDERQPTLDELLSTAGKIYE